MKIAAFQKNSMIDYAGNLSSVIFTAGCNFRCPYCHNAQLVIPEQIQALDLIEENTIFEYLEKNRLLLDAVVITGGEPTLHKYLPLFIQKIKKLGLKVKLDTNGTHPNMLTELIQENLLDYIAMDIKAPLTKEKYSLLTGREITDTQMNKIKSSVEIITSSGVLHEFRTTVLKELLSPEDVQQIIQIEPEQFYIQEYNNQSIINPEIRDYTSYSEKEIIGILTDPELYSSYNIRFR
ncbi:MAG: anaerobic ribonucleoside-triphosphate reductase activating protein [Bacteroidales bacterium]|nr:anaerobic ribonucleoside-triphosphate reductase activating protein [Bacteroidales bacterium]